jgi:hypothetical protein
VHACKSGPSVVDLDLERGLTENADGPTHQLAAAWARYRWPRICTSPVLKWAPLMGSWVAFVMQIQAEALVGSHAFCHRPRSSLLAMCTPLPPECVRPE